MADADAATTEEKNIVRLQVAAASAAETEGCFLFVMPLPLVAATTAAAESAAAAGGFLAEIDMVVDGGIDRICRQLHFLFRQDVTLPGLRTHR